MPKVPIAKQNDRTKYKYGLKFFFDSLEKEKKTDLIHQLESNSIGRSTFYKYMEIKHNDLSDIPAKRLDIFAMLLNTTAEELKNYITYKSEKNGSSILQESK